MHGSGAQRSRTCDRFMSAPARSFEAGPYPIAWWRPAWQKKVLLVVPEAPAPGGTALVDERRIDKRGIRLAVVDNSKGDADRLLRFIVEGLKAAVPVASVVRLRKASVSLPAPADILDRLTRETDVVISAMAD